MEICHGFIDSHCPCAWHTFRILSKVPRPLGSEDRLNNGLYGHNRSSDRIMSGVEIHWTAYGSSELLLLCPHFPIESGIFLLCSFLGLHLSNPTLIICAHIGKLFAGFPGFTGFCPGNLEFCLVLCRLKPCFLKHLGIVELPLVESAYPVFPELRSCLIILKGLYAFAYFPCLCPFNLKMSSVALSLQLAFPILLHLLTEILLTLDFLLKPRYL